MNDRRDACVTVVLPLSWPWRSPALGASAANKEHQQLMAEIRMLQEQQQQLQQMLGGLADTLKAMTTRLDSEADATRKAFADQKLLVNGIGRHRARAAREGGRHQRAAVDDDAGAAGAAADRGVDAGAVGGDAAAATIRRPAIRPPPAARRQAGAPGAPAPRTSPRPGCTTRPTPTTAAGQYDLAVDGFQAFIRTFPTSPKAAEAQLNIGYSLYNAGKNAEAVAALQKVITDYPQSDSVSSAYYKLGLTYEALKQPDNARKAFETVVQKYPSSYDAVLAQQALERLKRRRRVAADSSCDRARRRRYTDRCRLSRARSRSRDDWIVELLSTRYIARLERNIVVRQLASRLPPIGSSAARGRLRRGAAVRRPPTAARHRRSGARSGRRGSRWCSACCRPCRPTGASAAVPRRKSACPSPGTR